MALVDSGDLEPLDRGSGGRLIAAARIGTTRLIDNIRVIPDQFEIGSPPVNHLLALGVEISVPR